MPSPPRLIFANQLRGLAALLVVSAHMIGIYWAEPDTIARAMALPLAGGQRSVLFALVGQPWFNPGPFGVAVFFLISGLVIPISLARHNVVSFLLARAMRIYPTAIAAILIDIVIIRINAAYWHQEMPFGRPTMVANVLLINDFSGLPSIDLVNWTLGIELRFYVLMAIFAGPVLRGRLWPLFLTTGLSVLGNVSYGLGFCRSDGCYPVGVIMLDSTFVIFMMIGVLFNYHVRGLIGTGRAVMAAGGMFVLFVVGGLYGPVADLFRTVPIYYASALVLFTIAYAARRYAVPLTLPDKLAAISYPLYLVHTVVGISTMRWMMLLFNMDYHVAMAIGLAAALVVATVLHRTVEQWSSEWGRRRAVRPAAPALEVAEPVP